MAYDALKTEIRQYINTNGQEEITGQILQNVLLDMVNAYPSLDGYATQQWVSNQGFATETWVGQNFVQNSALSNYLPLTGGTLTGDLNFVDHNNNTVANLSIEETASVPAGTLTLNGRIIANGGVMGDNLSFDVEKSIWITLSQSARRLWQMTIGKTGNYVMRIFEASSPSPSFYIDDTFNIFATSFIKKGGTSAQFLKADGSVDNTSYLPLTGGMINGNLSVFNNLYVGSRLNISAEGGTPEDPESYEFWLDNGEINIDNQTVITRTNITANAFVKNNGTSAQFLKADGSVDSNTYLTSAAISDMATMTWVGQQGFLTSVPSGYATETWVGSNYLPLTGGTITSNLAVNGEFDTFSRIQVNGTSNAHPFLRLHIPNANWTRLQMDTLGVIHVLDGANGTSYNGFACGNATANSITLGRSTSGYGSIRFRDDEFVKIYRKGSDDSLVLCADSTAGGGIVLRSSENNPVSIITDIQGGTSNTMNWYIYNTGDAQFNSVSQTSDIRRKNIISDIGMDIDDIANTPMFRFTMKDDENAIVRVGTSAQYWQTLLPEVVSEDKRGVLGLQYDVAALAGVITVAKRVVDHEQRIAELEKENASLKARLNIN